jgi:two-component system, cell cycle sensor histidine kinase and response regulator CckA
MADRGAITIRAATSASRELVLIDVADTGPCIPPLALRRTFEPILARKTFGLWLGLATAYGIVRQMGGHVTVDSDANGTRFSIFLPTACRE